jgi:N-acetylglucosamine kinase-like BadF-type ATPase
MTRGAPWTVVDAGGTTSVVRSRRGRTEHPSVNPASVGEHVAAARMRALFADIADAASSDGPAWFATAGLDPAAPGEELGRIQAGAAAVRFRGSVVVSSDIVALLLVGLLGDIGNGRLARRAADAGAVAVVSGTGSGVRAGRLDAPPVTVGSQEYLASDEGSAFALAQDGLRAAVRAWDGRGPTSVLAERFEQRTGRPLSRLVRDLARTPFPKAAVAALADVVTGAWQDGDAVAGRVVEQALEDLETAALAGVRRAALRRGWRAVLSGGVFSGSTVMRDSFGDRLSAAGAAESMTVLDPAECVFRSLGTAVDPVPRSWLGAAVWELDPAAWLGDLQTTRRSG